MLKDPLNRVPLSSVPLNRNATVYSGKKDIELVLRALIDQS